MNLNIRERNWLLGQAFVQHSDEDYFDLLFRYAIWTVCLSLPGAILNAALYAGPFWLNPMWAWLTIPLTIAFILAAPNASRLHKAYGIQTKASRYSSGPDNLKRAKKYLALSKEDRKLFPANILETLKNKSLTDTQRKILDNEMDAVFKQINERDAALFVLEEREVDISGVVEALQQGREHAAIAARTYEEFGQK